MTILIFLERLLDHRFVILAMFVRPRSSAPSCTCARRSARPRDRPRRRGSPPRVGSEKAAVRRGTRRARAAIFHPRSAHPACDPRRRPGDISRTGVDHDDIRFWRASLTPPPPVSIPFDAGHHGAAKRVQREAEVRLRLPYRDARDRRARVSSPSAAPRSSPRQAISPSPSAAVPRRWRSARPAGARKPRPVEPSEIQKLQDQADSFTRKIEIEKRRCAELTQQISGCANLRTAGGRWAGWTHGARATKGPASNQDPREQAG